jgi:hypothetical protein
MRYLRELRVLLALFAVTAFHPCLQGQISQATLQGSVKDNTRAVVPNAGVSLKNKGTGETRSVVSGASGEYVIPNLNPAEYSLSATLTGFKTAVISSLTLHTGEQATVDLTLEVGATNQGWSRPS